MEMHAILTRIDLRSMALPEFRRGEVRKAAAKALPRREVAAVRAEDESGY
jgi:hypothetical protein